MKKFLSALLILIGIFLFSACDSQTPSVTERIKSFKEIKTDDAFLALFYRYMNDSNIVEPFIQYEEQLIKKGEMKNNSVKAYKDYISQLSKMDYKSFSIKCVDVEPSAAKKLYKLSRFSNSEGFLDFEKEIKSGTKQATHPYTLFKALLMGGVPDPQLTAKTIVEEDLLKEDNKYYYMVLVMSPPCRK